MAWYDFMKRLLPQQRDVAVVDPDPVQDVQFEPEALANAVTVTKVGPWMPTHDEPDRYWSDVRIWEGEQNGERVALVESRTGPEGQDTERTAWTPGSATRSAVEAAADIAEVMGADTSIHLNAPEGWSQAEGLSPEAEQIVLDAMAEGERAAYNDRVRAGWYSDRGEDMPLEDIELEDPHDNEPGGKDRIEIVQFGDWHNHDGIHESQIQIGQSDEGYHARVTISPYGGDGPTTAWSEAVPTQEQAWAMGGAIWDAATNSIEEAAQAREDAEIARYERQYRDEQWKAAIPPEERINGDLDIRTIDVINVPVDDGRSFVSVVYIGESKPGHEHDGEPAKGYHYAVHVGGDGPVPDWTLPYASKQEAITYGTFQAEITENRQEQKAELAPEAASLSRVHDVQRDRGGLEL